MNLWDFSAPIYRWLRKPWPLSHILRRETENIRALLSYVELSGGLVVDVGCGAGHSLRLLDGITTSAIGIDLSLKMARITRDKLKVPVVAAEAGRLPLNALSVDLFLAIGLIEYLYNPSTLFQQMAASGKPGCFVLATSSPPGFFTQMRRLNGIKLWPRNAEEVIASALRFCFHLVDQRTFWSQEAFLFRKSG